MRSRRASHGTPDVRAISTAIDRLRELRGLSSIATIYFPLTDAHHLPCNPATLPASELVNIRRATTADAAAISRLTAELGYLGTEDEIRSRLAELLNRDAHFIAVSELAEGIAGWVAAEERLILESGLRAEIVGLVVGSQYRRKGVGKKLVYEAESWARGRGLRTVFVRSNVARVEAHPFYESLGFSRKKTQHAYQKELAHA